MLKCWQKKFGLSWFRRSRAVKPVDATPPKLTGVFRGVHDAIETRKAFGGAEAKSMAPVEGRAVVR